LVAVCLGLPTISVACKTPGESALSRDRLERAEDLSESLANDLLAFSVSVRDRDAVTVATYFSDSVAATALPTAPPATEPVIKWIQ
jgi:hypothetical protein